MSKQLIRLHNDFIRMLEQLFHLRDDQMKKPIDELSLILSDERILMESINNTQVIFPSVTCIHHEFVCSSNETSTKTSC